MSNPNQKSGNSKPRNRRKVGTKKDNKIHKIARQEARKVVNKSAESKSFETYPAAINPSWIGTLQQFFVPQSGAGEQQYIGLGVMPTHIRIKGVISAGALSCVTRVILLQAKTTAPIVSGTNSLLDTTAMGTPLAPIAFYNNAIEHNYRVLFDEFYVNVIATESSVLSFDIRIKKDKLKQIRFAATAGQPSTGELALYFYTNIDPATVGNLPTIRYSTRTYFKDM